MSGVSVLDQTLKAFDETITDAEGELDHLRVLPYEVSYTDFYQVFEVIRAYRARNDLNPIQEPFWMVFDPAVEPDPAEVIDRFLKKPRKYCKKKNRANVLCEMCSTANDLMELAPVYAASIQYQAARGIRAGGYYT